MVFGMWFCLSKYVGSNLGVSDHEHGKGLCKEYIAFYWCIATSIATSDMNIINVEEELDWCLLSLLLFLKYDFYLSTIRKTHFYFDYVSQQYSNEHQMHGAPKTW